MSETTPQTQPSQPNRQPPTPTTEEIIERIEGVNSKSTKDLIGLELTVAMGTSNYSFDDPGEVPLNIDETPPKFQKQYVIRDVEKLQVKHVRQVPVGSSQFYFKKLVFTDPSLKFGKKLATITKVEEELRFVIDKLGTSGELEDVLVYSPSQLKKFVESTKKDCKLLSIGRVNQDSEPEKPKPANPERIPIKLSNREENAFKKISEQLEANDIYNWEGLSWKTTIEDLPKKDQEARKPTVLTAEVVREVLLTERVGTQSKPLRGFLVKQSDAKGAISFSVLKDDEMDKYFKQVKRYRNKAKSIDQWGQISEISIYKKPETNKAAPDTNLAGKIAEAAEILQRIEAESREAVWLLGYLDTIKPSDDEANKKREAKLIKFYSTPERLKRIEIVKAILTDYGLARVYTLAAEMKDNFKTAVITLGLPVDFSDTTETKKTEGSSISWAIEELADSYYYSQHPQEAGRERDGLSSGNPFSKDLAGKLRQRDIVDQRVGSALISETMHLNKTPKVTGVKDGQPFYELEEGLLFNKEPLMKIPNLTREQAKKLEESVYRDTQNKKAIRLVDLAQLGRLLRRSIGQ